MSGENERPHEEHKGSHADSETHGGDGGRPAPRLTGHALTYGHATLVQRENHAGESYDDGEELQRIQTHRLRGLRLRDALESYGQRDEHNNGDDDDENRTPRPDTGHSATNGGTYGRCDGDDERTHAHEPTHLGAGRLLKNDVDHQRRRDAGTHTLNDAGNDDDRKAGAHDHDERTDNSERHSRHEYGFHCETTLEIRGDGHGDTHR